MYEVIAEMLLIFKNYLRDVLKILLHEMYCFISVEIIKTLAAYCSNSLQTLLFLQNLKEHVHLPHLLKMELLRVQQSGPMKMVPQWNTDVSSTISYKGLRSPIV